MYIECSQSVQYFAQSFVTWQVLNTIESYDNMISSDNYLNVKHERFVFQHIVQIYLNTCWHLLVRRYERLDCCDHCISRQNNTSARSFFINNAFSSINKLLTPNMYCWSCKTLQSINQLWIYIAHKRKASNALTIIHLSPYTGTGHISEWMAFGWSHFVHRKPVTERCSLRDAFSGDVIIYHIV